VPSRDANRRALSRSMRPLSASRISAVFSSTPVNSWAVVRDRHPTQRLSSWHLLQHQIMSFVVVARLATLVSEVQLGDFSKKREKRRTPSYFAIFIYHMRTLLPVHNVPREHCTYN
jgi:hypothetical protein